MKAFFRSQAQRLTLRQSLGRTHMVTSLTAVCMAGLLLTGIALLALRIYADHNLELVARAISYTSEAAVVFHDEEAAKEALQAIVTREDVAQASIRLPNGRLLASWSRAMTTPWSGLEQYLAQLILPGPVEHPMMRGGVEIARVHLIALARRVQHQLRSMDLVCRLGGDEFAILLTPLLQESEAQDVVSRIQLAMADPVVLGDGRQLVAAISIGLAVYPDEGLTAGELLQQADNAMYQSKRLRRELALHDQLEFDVSAEEK